MLVAVCLGLVWGRYMYQREASGNDSLTYSLLPNGDGASNGTSGSGSGPHAYTGNALHAYEDGPGVVSARSSGSLKL